MGLLEGVAVVYVEDEELVRKEISTYLRRRVKILYEATNGEEGLSLIKTHNPDLIITDVEMPVMNGIEMIKNVRALYGNDKPIIVITGYSDEEHFTELATIYVYKPVNLRKLVETIESVLESLL